MSDDQPFFRFSPRAYSTGRSFEPSEATCDICRRPCIWRHTEGIYAAIEPESVCARCISDGSLVGYFGDQGWCLHDTDVNDVAPELATELLQRTPGVACFNPFRWPVLDGWPLAFVGYADETEILSDPVACKAISAVFAEVGWNLTGPSPYALVFRELAGTRYRAVLDLD